MPGSDRSDKEEVTMRHYKKSKHSAEKEKQRKRSVSNESNGIEKSRKKKKKERNYSDDEKDKDSTLDRSKSKKQRHDLTESKNSKNLKDSSFEERSERKKNEWKDKSSDNDIRRARNEDSSHRRSNKRSRKEDLEENKLHDDHKRRQKSDSEEKKQRGLSNRRNKHRDGSYELTQEGRSISREKSGGGRTNYADDSASQRRYDETESLPPNDDEGDQNTINSEKPYRYWSSSNKPVRKNSDSYWNKYSDRLKEPEHVEVGPRYYGASENSKKDQTVNDHGKEQKDNVQLEKDVPKTVPAPRVKKNMDLLTSRAGGAYIPPAKLRMMQESITDKASAAYQRLAWEALKKSIQGHINKVNTSNIKTILKVIQKENIVRGRGLLCRALVQAQAASPTFTNVYAAFVAALNCKFPKIGELLLKRLVVQFRRGFKRNDKTICITAVTFIAHLVNQEVAHEIIALEILTLLIETPTDDSVEVAIAFMKECGMKLTEVASKGLMAIFDMLRNILHEGKLEKRVQYMIEVMFQIRKEDFKAHPSIVEELDLVSEDDRIQHMITIEETHDPEDILNVFKLDPDYEANEAKYKTLVEVDSDDEDADEGSSGSGDSEDDSESEEEGQAKEKESVIVDKTETNLVVLRKTIYLTIQSSLDFEECAHKLLRMQLKPGQEIEMAHMFLDCCAEQRTYEKFFGLLSQRFCQINRMYVGPFEQTFRDSYETIHRMSNDKLRNVAKLFAHLLYTDAISWDVLAIIRLNEDDTTSSSRIFIKILFLELSEYMGLAKLNQRVKDPSLQTALEGLFPRDNPKYTRFAINFFTSIGLGGLTDELREHLKAQPKHSLAVPQLVEGLSSSSSSDSSSDSSDSSDSSSESSSSDSSSSESEDASSRKKSKGNPVSKKKSHTPKKPEKAKSSRKRKASLTKRNKDR